MQVTIIALMVSDADFETLEGLKKAKGIGWNQLLLEPAETAYGLTLESAHPAKPKAEPTGDDAEPAKKTPAAETDPTAEAIQETETEG